MEKDYFDQIKSYKGSFVSYLILKEAIDVRGCASCGRCQKAVNDAENRNLFHDRPEVANLQTLPLEIKKAKYTAGRQGAVAVNIMSVTQLYGEYVRIAADAGVDAIISGAGLPISLPEYVEGTDVKIAPVVSSRKAADVILRMWDKKYHRTADFLVMESPYSGGHQGYKKEELKDLESTFKIYEQNVRQTVELKKWYEIKYDKTIPLFLAGGVFTKEDTLHAFELGADGIQAGTRFIATKECDASDAYKQAFIQATAEESITTRPPQCAGLKQSMGLKSAFFGFFQRSKVFPCPSVINAEELIGSGSHIDILR